MSEQNPDAGAGDAGAAAAAAAAAAAGKEGAAAGAGAEGDKSGAAAGADGAAKAGEAGKDGKGGDVKPGDGRDTKEGDAGAPVDYAKTISEVQMPEGFVLDAEAAKVGGELFAKHNIPPEAVKDLVALYAQQQKAGADGNAKAFSDQVGAWKATSEKETTPEERGTAKEAALRIFGKDEVALLEHFGVTNRAGFIKALSKIGKMAIQDDTLVRGNAGGDADRDARAHFPKSNMNP